MRGVKALPLQTPSAQPCTHLPRTIPSATQFSAYCQQALPPPATLPFKSSLSTSPVCTVPQHKLLPLPLLNSTSQKVASAVSSRQRALHQQASRVAIFTAKSDVRVASAVVLSLPKAFSGQSAVVPHRSRAPTSPPSSHFSNS